MCDEVRHGCCSDFWGKPGAGCCGSGSTPSCQAALAHNIFEQYQFRPIFMLIAQINHFEMAFVFVSRAAGLCLGLPGCAVSMGRSTPCPARLQSLSLREPLQREGCKCLLHALVSTGSGKIY